MENTIAQNLVISYPCGPQQLETVIFDSLGGRPKTYNTYSVSTEVSPVIGPAPNTSQLNAPDSIILEQTIGAQSYG